VSHRAAGVNHCPALGPVGPPGYPSVHQGPPAVALHDGGGEHVPLSFSGYLWMYVRHCTFPIVSRNASRLIGNRFLALCCIG
jgi:hypothetical protein